MTQTQEKAAVYFRSGLNCAQSVLSAFSERYGTDKELSKSIACAFGGGMGRMQETCGAVTGAFMVIGLHASNLSNDYEERKLKSYSMVLDYDARFKAIYGTTNCKSILKTDINTEEGHKWAVENNLFDRVCTRCVTDSVKILEEILNDR